MKRINYKSSAVFSDKIMLKNNVVLSPIVMDKNTFNWYKKNRGPFYKNIRKDGIEFWTKHERAY